MVLWGQNSKMQRKEKQNREWNWFMQECNISWSIFFFFFSRAYYLPQGRQTFSSKAYSGNERNVLLKSFSEPFLRGSRKHPQLPQRFSTDVKLNMDLRQWSLKYSTNLTSGYGTWKEHWRMNACLTETWGSDSMRHTLGEVFQSAGLLALVTLMPSAAHALAFTIPPTH